MLIFHREKLLSPGNLSIELVVFYLATLSIVVMVIVVVVAVPEIELGGLDMLDKQPAAERHLQYNA